MISVDFVTCLICRQLIMQTKIPVHRHFHNWMTGLNSLQCVRVIGITHVFSSQLQIFQSHRINLTKKRIYKLNLDLFENMVCLRFKKRWFWSYSHATSLFKSVGNHNFYAFVYLLLMFPLNFTLKIKLSNEYSCRCIKWNAESVTNRFIKYSYTF